MTFQTTLRGLTWAYKWGERPNSSMVYGTNEQVQVMGSWLVLINLTRKNQVQYYFDLFSTKTDQHQFSPNNVNTESGEKVMRIIDMNTQGKMLFSRKCIEITQGDSHMKGASPPGDITLENLYLDIGPYY